jgi:lysozyme family protein
MKSNLDSALAFVLKDKGGYAERDTEGGGAFNMGVTFTVFAAWRQGKGLPMPTFANLKAMTREEAIEIYKAQYLKGVSFDDMPIGVDYVVLDAAVNGGVTGSLMLLQIALGMNEVDGHFGAVTKWAANHRDVPELISKFCATRLAKYKTFKRFTVIANPTKKDGTPTPKEKLKTWGDIWSARIQVVEKRALAMTGKPSVFVAPLPLLTALKPVGKGAMQGIIRRGFTPEQFRTYLQTEVAPQMTVWRPCGVVIHNTGAMKWPGVANGKTITPEQRLENMSVDWVRRKFNGGPHLVVSPDGMIWAVWPLWKQGTHSPSFNATYWGIEIVGDFNIETPPEKQRAAALSASADMLSMLGRVPNDDTVKFHKEDPRTTHKVCPGKNLGAKAAWIKDTSAMMAKANPGELRHVA